MTGYAPAGEFVVLPGLSRTHASLKDISPIPMKESRDSARFMTVVSGLLVRKKAPLPRLASNDDLT